MTKWMMTSLLGTSLLGACLDEGTRDDKDSTDETEQQVLDYGQTGMTSCSWGRVCPPISLGQPRFGRVCYISGLKGDLYAASVTIGRDANGNDALVIIPGPNRTVSASAACTDFEGFVAGSGNWTAGQGATPLNAGTGAQCVITSVRNTNAFENNTDQIRVAQDGNGNWNLGGSIATGHYASASAQCFSPSTPTGGIGWENFSGNVEVPFSPLTGGMICAPTRFQGNFTYANSEVSVGIDNGLAEWYLKVGHAAGTASCFF